MAGGQVSWLRARGVRRAGPRLPDRL